MQCAGVCMGRSTKLCCVSHFFNELLLIKCIEDVSFVAQYQDLTMTRKGERSISNIAMHHQFHSVIRQLIGFLSTLCFTPHRILTVADTTNCLCVAPSHSSWEPNESALQTLSSQLFANLDIEIWLRILAWDEMNAMKPEIQQPIDWSYD